MKMGKVLLTILIVVMFVSGSAYGYQRDPNSSRPAPKQKPLPKTSLELQAIQSKEFETDKK